MDKTQEHQMMFTGASSGEMVSYKRTAWNDFKKDNTVVGFLNLHFAWIRNSLNLKRLGSGNPYSIGGG